MAQCVLVINPGSTSTKIAVFEGATRVFEHTVSHSSEEMNAFSTVAAQYEYRRTSIMKALEAKGFDMKRLSAVVGRGGALHPIPSGVYRVNEAMKGDLLTGKYGEHASNLGGLIADSLASKFSIPAFIVDPIVVDELWDVARVSGHKLFSRLSLFHALNQKAVARRFAAESGKKYEELSLIVAHMGGGVSIGFHYNGKVVDVNQALGGEGPFSPERSGTLPANALAKLCFSGKYTEKEVMKMISGAGGMVSFLGTNDMRDVEKLHRAGDPEATLYYEAFIYQVGKAIGALAAAAHGKVDGIILTGGIAYGKEVVDGINAMCSFIAPIIVYPGEGELEALALSGLNAISGKTPILEYRP